MLNKIVQFSLHNRLLMILVFTALVVAGIFVSNSMDIDVFPDFTAPTVVIMTEAHGMASEEVEKLVTFPIESAMNGSMSVRRIRSSSTTGFSIVFVEFDWGTNLFRARQVVGEKLLTIKENLPEGTGEPTLAPQSSVMGEIMFISLASDSTSPMALRSLADWKVRPALLGLGGIAQVTVIGGELKQYQIEADPFLMYNYGVTLNELYSACDDINANAPGGILNQYGNEYVITGLGRSGNLDDLGATVVKSTHDTVIRIKDVANLKTVAAPKLGDGSLNARPAVLLSITKQPDINTVDLTRRIDATMDQIRKELPGDITVNTQIFRQSDFIESSVNNVGKALIEGALFVVIILIVFLLNFRTTIISVLAIPISLLITIIVIRLMGYTINTMSLGGMAIAIGALVDDAIIFVDNVFRRLKENIKLDPSTRKSYLEVIQKASAEIRSSIVNADAIIIISFIPLFFLGGMEGRMLKPLGISFIVALASSLLVAITLTPVLSSYLLTGQKMLTRQKSESRTVGFLNKYYQKALQWALRNDRKVLWITGAILIGAVALYTTFGRSFLPEFNEGSLTLTAVTMPGISLEESNKIGNQVERTMLSIPEVKSTSRKTGRSELDEHAQSVNGAEIDCPFVLDKRSRDEFMKDVRNRLATIRGVNVIVGQPLGHRIDHMLSGTRANIAIKIFGPDNAILLDLGNNVADAIRNIPGVVDVSPEQMTAVPQIQIIPRREVMSQVGITMREFHDAVDIAIGGKKIGEIYEKVGKFNLVLRYPENVRNQIEKLGEILVDNQQGKKIPLGVISEIRSTTTPNTISRENLLRKTVVSVNIAERDLQSSVADIKKTISEKVSVPSGYSIEYGGKFESAAAASKIIMLASILSVILIFLILNQEFKTTKLSLTILLNLPLALIGGIVAVYLSGRILNIPSLIGFITLFGIATRNGILLVSNFERLREQGMLLTERVIHGSVQRLSPIMMTALTAGLALIPMALAYNAQGNEIQSPMAKVILGGLISSTLLNLFIIPIVYILINRRESHA